MGFRITDLYFSDHRETRERPILFDQDRTTLFDQDCEIGPRRLPRASGRRLRRWGASLALAGLVLPGVSFAGFATGEVPAVEVVDASLTGDAEDLREGAAGGTSPPGSPAPWETAMVDADGKPLPTAPPPGPVPVNGIPQPARVPAKPKVNPGPGATAQTLNRRPAATPAGVAEGLVPAGREYLRPILIRYARENGLPADLVMSLAWVESSWRRNAVSGVGAVGVMQLMPITVEHVSKELLGLGSNLDPKNPTSNVRMGARYLRHLLDKNRGSMRRALIAYNQGLHSLHTNGSYAIAERYADRVLALRPQFRSA